MQENVYKGARGRNAAARGAETGAARAAKEDAPRAAAVQTESAAENVRAEAAGENVRAAGAGENARVAGAGRAANGEKSAAAVCEIGKCPNCGGRMKEETQGFVCPYCGTRAARQNGAAAIPAGGAQAENAEKSVQSGGARAAESASGAQTADYTQASGAPAEAAAAQAESANTQARRARRKLFSASGIAKLAMLSALAFAVSYLEFPIFPAAPFLQMDFSLVFVLLGGFLYGPAAAIVISGIKECLRLFTSGTAGVGELANFIVTVSFVVVPTLVYRFKKGLPVVIITLAVGCFLEIGVSLLTNRYINFPLFMGEGAAAQFELLWWYVLLFNLIKSVAVSLVTVLLYKRISWLFNKF